MGKRSDFKRRAQDAYDTPESAVLPLLPHLEFGAMFSEPCAGAGRLMRALESHGLSCVWASDIEPRHPDVCHEDAMEVVPIVDSADLIITNPPWSRPILHSMIERFSWVRPTWLLFDADWMHTKQAIPYLTWCRKIVSVGRVSWMENGTSGKDNCAWYLFDQNADGPTRFIGRAA